MKTKHAQPGRGSTPNATMRVRSTKPSPTEAADAAPFLRRTITLPPEIAEKVDAIAGPGKFSSFTQRALLHELQRERIAAWLEDRVLARDGKPLDDSAITFAEAAWQARNKS